MPPSRSIDVWVASVVAAGSARSQITATPDNSSATAPHSSVNRSMTAIEAPWAAKLLAIAAPMPRAPPVTTTRAPTKRSPVGGEWLPVSTMVAATLRRRSECPCAQRVNAGFRRSARRASRPTGLAVRSRSPPARSRRATAMRSAGAPAVIATGGSPSVRRDASVTADQATAGRSCTDMIIKPAVSNGHARPTGLNGSWRLSAPAATLTPAVRNAATAVRPRGMGAVPRPWRNRLVWGRAITLTPASATSSATTALFVGRELPEAHAMAGGRGVREPGEHAPRELGEPARCSVERLVGVEIHWHRELGRQLEEEVGRGRARLALEVRAAADEVGPGLERLAEKGSVRGPGDARHRPAAQGHDLHVDHVGDPTLDLEQRLDAAQSVLLRRVGVGAYGGEPVGGHQPRRPFRPFDDVGHVEQVPVGLHRQDRTHQVAGRVLDPLGEERLVEVGMGLDGGGEQQVAIEIDHDVARAAV